MDIDERLAVANVRKKQESVVRLVPAGCLLLLNHLSAEHSCKPQPYTAYAGKEVASCGLDRKKLAVCRRRNQAVEVMTSQLQGVEVEELQVRRNGGMDLSRKSEEMRVGRMWIRERPLRMLEL